MQPESSLDIVELPADHYIVERVEGFKYRNGLRFVVKWANVKYFNRFLPKVQTPILLVSLDAEQ